MADKALDLFEQISKAPNEFQYAIAFNACAMFADDRAMQLGNKLFRQLQATHKRDTVITGAVLKMLMKFGQVKDAEDVLRTSDKKSAVTYGVMMQGWQLFEKSALRFETIHLTYRLH